MDILKRIQEDEQTFKHLSQTILEQLVSSIPVLDTFKCEDGYTYCTIEMDSWSYMNRIPLLQTLQKNSNVSISPYVSIAVGANTLLMYEPRKIEVSETRVYVEVATTLHTFVLIACDIKLPKMVPTMEKWVYKTRLKTKLELARNIREEFPMFRNIPEIPIIVEANASLVRQDDSVRWRLDIRT